MNYKWNNAALYESYVGRWSRLTAVEFLNWLNMNSGLLWLDVGCGTGALTDAILKTQEPKKVIGADPSESQIQYTWESIQDTRAEFIVSNAESLDVSENSADVLVSGLVLNFIPELSKALLEFKRTVKNGGTIAAYVWDYSGKMELMRYFWDAAVRLFEDAREIDEAARFEICNPERLADEFNSAGLKNTEVTFIDVPTVFKDFDDYWTPFLSGIGPAPGYCMSLTEEKRNILRSEVHKSLPIEKNGSIKLIARAIAVKAENNNTR
jgi:ubiquinone/menaquinone biosynthesis C-methylase UbiE